MSSSGRLNHFVTLMKNVADVKEMCDAILVAGKDNRKFPVHRLIMRGASEYFHSLLGPNFREASDENIVLKDIDGETLKSIINYIYHGEITIDHRNVCAIAAASLWMRLIELEERCAEFGENDLNAENCIGILLDADEHHLVEMKSKAFDMICVNYGKLSIDDIALIDETTYRELLACDQLSGEETNIFNGMVCWLTINKADDDESISEFLKLIRLKHITKQILMETVDPFFVSHNQMVLVYDEYRRRLLHPNKSFGPRRWSPKDIHLVSTDAYEQYLTFSKYDRDANDWIEMRKESSGGPNGNMVVVNDKLYVLGGTDSNGYAQGTVCTFQSEDFTRVELPNMIKTRTNSASSVVLGNFIYMFGGEPNQYSYSQNSFSCERFDIEGQTWTMRSNMPISSQSATVDAIEYNEFIHVAFYEYNSSRTQLYCYIPASDTWQHKATVTNRAIFAKTSSSLYVIVGEHVLHRYDPTKKDLTSIGDFIFTGNITHTIELGDEIYLLGESDFVKLNLQENVKSIKLKMTKCSNSRSLYLN